MTFEEAAEILGEDGVRRAEEFVASLPPLSEAQVEAIARILHGSALAQPVEADEQRPAAHDAA